MTTPSKVIYDIIKDLQATSSDNDKQAILRRYKDVPYFKEYMKAVYDTVNINYYIKAIQPAPPGNLAECDNDFVQWLIDNIASRKITGNQAKSTLKQAVACMTEEGQEMAKYIIDRSIGAGVGDTMVLNTWPGLYFIPPYMRCKSMTKKLKEKYSKLDSFFVQTKRDGSFAYLQRRPKMRAVTRQGSQYPSWLVERLTYMMASDVVLMGEFEVDFEGVPMARADANGVLSSVLKGAPEDDFKGHNFRYVVWDCVTAEEFEAGTSDTPYDERLDNAGKVVHYMVDAWLIDSPEVTSVAAANKIHIANTKIGLEGTVWKTKKGGWKNSSSGTDDMVKNKVVFVFEAEVTGYTEGEGKDAGSLGSVDMASKCRRVKFQCGSGFSAKQRKDFWAIKEQLLGKIFSVEGNDITTSRTKETFAISLPIFIDERFDKTEADDYERIVEQFEAAKEGRELL